MPISTFYLVKCRQLFNVVRNRIDRKLQSRVEKYMKGGFKTDNTPIPWVQYSIIFIH